MKKALGLILTGLLVFGLAGCSGESATSSSSEQNTPKQETSQNTPKQETSFKLGETWTVDGQWSITMDSVVETKDRNPYSEKNPAAVYILDYTYENIGYEDKNGIMDGLFISPDEIVIDSAGVMGYSYPGDIVHYATETPVGATCKAQVCIGVDNPGDFKVQIVKFDGNGKKQQAEFLITVD